MKYQSLKDGEVIQEGDEITTVDFQTGKSMWIKIMFFYVGRKYKEGAFLPMRRPIPQSVDFIKEG